MRLFSIALCDYQLYLYDTAGQNPFGIRPTCDFSSEFRTIDGTCNNKIDLRNGAAKIPLRRLVPNTYEDG